MIELKYIHQFIFANTFCNVIKNNADSRYEMNSTEATELLDNIIRWATKEDRLSETLLSADLRSTTLLIASTTTRTGILCLFHRLHRLNAWELQAALASQYPIDALISKDENCLLDGIDTIISLAL